MTGLSGAFILSGLKADDAFAGPKLRLRKFTAILLRWSGTQPGTSPFGVFVGGTSDGKNVLGHQGDVFLVPQVCSLEQVDVRNAVSHARLLEPENYTNLFSKLILNFFWKVKLGFEVWLYYI